MHRQAAAGNASGGTEATHHIPWPEPLGRTQCTGGPSEKVQGAVRRELETKTYLAPHQPMERTKIIAIFVRQSNYNGKAGSRLACWDSGWAMKHTVSDALPVSLHL